MKDNFLRKIELLKFINLLISFALFLLLNSCTSEQSVTDQNLEGSRWEYHFENDSSETIDYIDFQEKNRFKSFSAESGDEFIGIYFIENDTINLVELGSYGQLGYSEINEHRILPVHYQGIIRDNVFKYIGSYQFKNHEWVKSDFTFSEQYEFKKKIKACV